MLAGPLDTPATIQRLAALSEVPAVEETETIPEKAGEQPQTVRFCRVDDDGLAETSGWARKNQYFMWPVQVVFEGEERRYAHEAMFNGPVEEQSD